MRKIKLIYFITGLYLIFAGAISAKNAIKPLVHIPFTTNGYQTYLELKVNNSSETVCFVFDTGCGGTVIDKSFLEQCNIKLEDTKEEMATATNVVSVDVSLNNTIHLNDFSIDSVKFFVENLSHLSTAPNGKKVAGVIGFDMLNDYVVLINHVKNYIELYPSGTKLFTTACTIPIYLYENELPAFEAKIVNEGKELPVHFIFDSGASFTTALSSNFIANNNFEQRLKKKVQIPVIGGAESASAINYLSSLNKLQFGDFTFEDVPVNFSTSANGAMANNEIDGVIGFDLIKKFDVVLDYQNKYIRLIQNKNYKTPLNYNLTGLSLRTNDNLVTVWNVMDSSPAKNSGMIAGDNILSVDGKKFTSSAQLREYLKNSYKTKTFVVQRGEEQLTFKLKPNKFY